MTEEKCDICEEREGNWSIQHSLNDICDRCWVVYMQVPDVPDWVKEEQTYRYRRIKVRKIRGLQI